VQDVDSNSRFYDPPFLRGKLQLCYNDAIKTIKPTHMQRQIDNNCFLCKSRPSNKLLKSTLNVLSNVLQQISNARRTKPIATETLFPTRMTGVLWSASGSKHTSPRLPGFGLSVRLETRTTNRCRFDHDYILVVLHLLPDGKMSKLKLSTSKCTRCLFHSPNLMLPSCHQRGPSVLGQICKVFNPIEKYCFDILDFNKKPHPLYHLPFSIKRHQATKIQEA
jgi:hypothetical protein